jgi:hypothetical protein
MGLYLLGKKVSKVSKVSEVSEGRGNGHWSLVIGHWESRGERALAS